MKPSVTASGKYTKRVKMRTSARKWTTPYLIVVGTSTKAGLWKSYCAKAGKTHVGCKGGSPSVVAVLRSYYVDRKNRQTSHLYTTHNATGPQSHRAAGPRATGPEAETTERAGTTHCILLLHHNPTILLSLTEIPLYLLIAWLSRRPSPRRRLQRVTPVVFLGAVTPLLRTVTVVLTRLTALL